MEQRTPRRFFSKRNTIIIAGVLLLLLLADLFLPLQRDLRSFDAHEMARLETAMWESYYDRKPVKIYFELAEMLRSQFGFPFFRSLLGAYYAAYAAFVFKDHKNDADLRRAEELLVSYFTLIRNTGNILFDVNKEAKLELQWWIVHRRRNEYSEEELGKACADAAAALYQISPEAALDHGRFRAAAMTIRDTKAQQGGVQPDDWKRIEELLLRCYRSLYESINNRAAGILFFPHSRNPLQWYPECG